MSKKTRAINDLPWFKFWTGTFRSKTDRLGNAEVGAYVRLLASYWDNNGLPYTERALTRIAKIEAGDNVDLGEILGEFFIVEDSVIRHEELDALRIEAIGEEDARKRRTLPGRIALAERRKAVTIPVTETDVEEDIEEDIEEEEYPDPEPEGEAHSDETFRSQTHNQMEDLQSEPEGETELEDRARLHTHTQTAEADEHGDVDCLPGTDESGDQISQQTAPARTHRSASLKPDGGARGDGVVPAADSVPSGIKFVMNDGSSIPLSSRINERHLSIEMLTALKRLAETFESSPHTRVSAEMLPYVLRRCVERSRKAA